MYDSINATLQITGLMWRTMSQITHHVAISGMTCGGCSGRVTNVLANTPGVIQAEISHESNSGVIVSTDEISIQEIIEIVNNTGFEANEY